MEMGEFHNRDGWYFKRHDDGSVRIQKRTPDAANTVEQTHTIPPNEWVSIIAWVAANGGSGGNYAEATQFHAGQSFVRRGGDVLVLGGAANAEEERARVAEPARMQRTFATSHGGSRDAPRSVPSSVVLPLINGAKRSAFMVDPSCSFNAKDL